MYVQCKVIASKMIYRLNIEQGLTMSDFRSFSELSFFTSNIAIR